MINRYFLSGSSGYANHGQLFQQTVTALRHKREQREIKYSNSQQFIKTICDIKRLGIILHPKN